MTGIVRFMRCVGRAAVKNGGRALARLLPLGEATYEIARDAYEDYHRDHGEAQLRAEMHALFQAPPTEAVQPVEVRELPVIVPGPQRSYTLARLLEVGDVADV